MKRENKKMLIIHPGSKETVCLVWYDAFFSKRTKTADLSDAATAEISCFGTVLKKASYNKFLNL